MRLSEVEIRDDVCDVVYNDLFRIFDFGGGIGRTMLVESDSFVGNRMVHLVRCILYHSLRRLVWGKLFSCLFDELVQ